jgi:uncharacterized protein (TIGR02646 family)
VKHIVKGNEPRSLVEHRSQHYADYDNYSQKDDLRQSLLTEQGYICCYCMQRIAHDTMKIEHWQPQSIYPDLQLDYRNLLGACHGYQGQPQRVQHCDTRKGETEITINPADASKNCENFIKYRSNGQIYSDDETINNELNEVLNLNLEALTRNRKAAMDAVLEGLRKKYPSKSWTVGILSKEITKFAHVNKKAKYRPYCQFVVFLLNKKLSVAKNQAKSQG